MDDHAISRMKLDCDKLERRRMSRPKLIFDRRVTRATSSQVSSRKSVHKDGPSLFSRRSRVASVDENYVPSPTAARLRSLATAVKAADNLGLVRVSNKYMAASAEFSSEHMKVPIANLSIDNEAVAPKEVESSQVCNQTSTPDRPISAESSASRKKSIITADRIRSASILQKPSSATLKRMNSIRGDLKTPLSTVLSNFQSGNNTTSLQTSEYGQDAKMPKNLCTRLNCAKSLYKLSCLEGHELKVIQGGAISQIADMADVENAPLLRYCAAAISNLTTTAALRSAFMKQNGLLALLELCWAQDIEVKVICATALCRLSFDECLAPALENARVVFELLAMLSLSNRELQMLAVKCVINLIYYDISFPERVYVGEPQTGKYQPGIMTVIGHLADISHIEFAVEAIYNLSIKRECCASAARGGAADILLTLTTDACKMLDESISVIDRDLSIKLGLIVRPTLGANSSALLTVLSRIAKAFANISAHFEFHVNLAHCGARIFSMLLLRALHDLGSNTYGSIAKIRLQHVVIPCARALANLSSNTEPRKHIFQQDVVRLAARMLLLDRQQILSEGHDRLCLLRNVMRTICNISFDENCAVYMMEFPAVLPLLYTIATCRSDHEENKLTAIVDRTVLNLDDVTDDIREDAVVTISNLAQRSVYHTVLAQTLDGSVLALAADDRRSTRSLQYMHVHLLCNLLLTSRLQTIVYGDMVVRSLVHGVYFFREHDQKLEQWTKEKREFELLNIAFDDDQELFLLALLTVASEIMDPRNISMLVDLVVDCLSGDDDSIKDQAAIAHQHKLNYLAAAILFTLSRSYSQRRGHQNPFYSEQVERALIAVCERPINLSAPCITFCQVTKAYCAATLFHICAAGNVDKRIIEALINCCNSSEEPQSLLACSSAFAMISLTPLGRKELVNCGQLAKALNRLGRNGQVECQQYAAIAACNAASEKCIWTSNELKDFVVIALLRANSIQAKQIHAKTFSNLLCNQETRASAVKDGVLYALMKISQLKALRSEVATERSASAHSKTSVKGNSEAGVDTSVCRCHTSTQACLLHKSAEEIFHVALQALFNVSCDRNYQSHLLGKGIITYLLSAVSSNSRSQEGSTSESTSLLLDTYSSELNDFNHDFDMEISFASRRYALGIICNLSAYEENHKELMNTFVTDAIRMYVDDESETRAAAAIALQNLSCRQPWVEILCERKTLQLLSTLTEDANAVVRHFAVQALANCSRIYDSHHLFAEFKIPQAVPELFDSLVSESEGTQNTGLGKETYLAIFRCLENLAIDDTLAEMIVNENIVLRLLVLVEHRSIGNDEKACIYIADVVNVLAKKYKCADSLLKQRLVSLCGHMRSKHPKSALLAVKVVQVLVQMSMYQHIHKTLVESQIVDIVMSICTSDYGKSFFSLRRCGAELVRNLSLAVTEQLVLYDEYESASGEKDSTTTTYLSSHKISSYGSPESQSGQIPSKNAIQELSSKNNFDSGVHSINERISRLTQKHLLYGVRHLRSEVFSICSGNIPTSNLEDCLGALLDTSAALDNLSTAPYFKQELIDLGAIDMLLKMYQYGQVHSNISEATLLQRISASTLHRLVGEGSQIETDADSLLVPSLLSILDQTDEELHEVRYQCEKVSLHLPSASDLDGNSLQDSSSLSNRFVESVGSFKIQAGQTCNGTNAVNAPGSFTSQSHRLSSSKTQNGTENRFQTKPALACVLQTFMQPSWTVYIVKTTLSTAPGMPLVERRQVKTIGLARGAYEDVLTATKHPVHVLSTQISQSTSKTDKVAAMRAAGVLMTCNDDKYIIKNEARAGSCTSDSKSQQDVEEATYTCKFQRHMQSTRRKQRQNLQA